MTDSVDASTRHIVSDQAVELREDKGSTALLLLVDAGIVGAGMDGIYSATREITEDLLFDEAYKHARENRRTTTFKFARICGSKEARRVGERRAISRWQEFEFLASVATALPESIGRCIRILGLWPIQHENAIPRNEDLQLSARLVERLLLGASEERTPAGGSGPCF